MSNVVPIESRVSVTAELQEKALLGGDLSKLSVVERLSYYNAVCASLGLNPLTRPFGYISFDGQTQLYARKDCTEQLRNQRAISVKILAREVVEGVYVVTAQATEKGSRTDESIGAVAIDKLQGQFRANAMMKAETKAKRRVTLSICGLGMLDETEIDTIPGAKVAQEEESKTAEPAQKSDAVAEPSLELDYAAAIDAAEGELLKAVWDEIVHDGRLTGPTRAKLYKCYQVKLKATK